MSTKFDDRYNEKRPVLAFRVTPDIKDKLSDLQYGTDKTLSEIAENILTEALLFPNKNSAEKELFSNKNNSNNVNQIDSDVYEKAFKNGYKLGNNHAKNEIKNKINDNLKNLNGELNNLIKNHLNNSKDECAECGNKFVNENFDFCPHCGVEFVKNEDNEKIAPMLDFSSTRIPIISDILEFLGFQIPLI